MVVSRILVSIFLLFSILAVSSAHINPFASMHGSTAGSAMNPFGMPAPANAEMPKTSGGTQRSINAQSAYKSKAMEEKMEMSPFQKILQKLKMEKYPEVPKCEMDDVDVYCGELKGIYYKWDDGDFNQVYSSRMLPINVPDGKKLLVAVCSFGNHIYRPNVGYLHLPLLPALIGNVGEKAKVSLQIKNSANVESYGDINLESELNKAKTLIPPLVVGKVSEEAKIGVKIIDSGNLKLSKEVKKFKTKNSVMVSTLIKPSNEKCIEKACFSIEAEGVANIFAKNGSYAEVGLHYTSLVAPIFMAKCSKEMTLRAEVKNSACVLGAKNLEMENHSYAINPVVAVKEAEESKFLVEIEESANVHVMEELELKDSSVLLVGALYAEKGKEIMAKAKIDGSANVFAKELKLEKSRIVADVIIAMDSKMGVLCTSIENTANIMAKEAVILEGESKVIGCGLKLGGGPTLLFNIARLDMSGNIRAGKVHLKEKSAIIDKIIGAKDSNQTAFLAKVKGCGNIATSKETELEKSCLIHDLVDIGDAKGPFKAKIVAEYVANVLCGKGYAPELKLKYSKLLSSGLEVSTKIKDPMTINADMKLGFVGNSFIKTKTEYGEKLVDDVFNQSKTGADHVSIEQKSVGKMLSCEM